MYAVGGWRYEDERKHWKLERKKVAGGRRRFNVRRLKLEFPCLKRPGVMTPDIQRRTEATEVRGGGVNTTGPRKARLQR